jgi:hypothetical protein
LTGTSRTFSILISNAGRNPDSVKSTGNWKISAENYLKISSTSSSFLSYTVDTGTAEAFTTTAGTIKDANVILTSPKITSDQNQLYKF